MCIALDYDVWKLHYGEVYAPGGGGLAMVPEPATGGLLAAGFAVLIGRRKTGRDGRAI
jgi:hypothetical protein